MAIYLQYSILTISAFHKTFIEVQSSLRCKSDFAQETRLNNLLVSLRNVREKLYKVTVKGVEQRGAKKS